MDEDLNFGILKELQSNYNTSISDISKYMLPIKFNQGEILYFIDGNDLNLNVFYSLPGNKVYKSSEK